MRRHNRLNPFVTVLALLICTSSLAAQETGEKKPLTMDDYSLWRSVSSTAISDDGKWVTFAYSQFESNDTLYVQSLGSDTEYIIPLASRPQFSDDSNWLAYMITLPFKEAEKLRDDRKPVPNKAELINLETGEKLTWENVTSFSFPKGSSHFLVKKAKTDSDAEHDGTDIILRNLSAGYEELIGSVDQFSFNKPGSVLAYTVNAADQNGNGVYYIRLDTGARRPLDNGSADYVRMTWDEEGSALAVLKGTDIDTLEHAISTLLAFTGVTGRRMAEFVYDPAADPEFSEGMVITSGGGLTWSEGERGKRRGRSQCEGLELSG